MLRIKHGLLLPLWISLYRLSYIPLLICPTNWARTDDTTSIYELHSEPRHGKLNCIINAKFIHLNMHRIDLAHTWESMTLSIQCGCFKGTILITNKKSNYKFVWINYKVVNENVTCFHETILYHNILYFILWRHWGWLGTRDLYVNSSIAKVNTQWRLL